MAVLEAASEAAFSSTVLQPADVFVELAGEEFRKRLFTTEGPNGEALCLRPDFTIPVCLHHLSTARQTPTAYAYRGKIFRRRRAYGRPEFEQAGTEWIGHDDEMGTDARLFALAVECAEAVGLVPDVRVGDANIFGALLKAVGLSSVWRHRLSVSLGEASRMSAALDRLTRGDQADGIGARLAPALAQVDERQARAIVEAVIGMPGHASVGGRTARDIAERIMDQAANAATGDVRAAEVIQRYLSIDVPLSMAADTIAGFAREEGLALDGAVEAFAARTRAMDRRGIGVDTITFQAGFARRLGYYTGFVFEMVDPRQAGAEVIAGGRYDKLISLLDPKRSLPAIGFSVWLDRLPGAEAQPVAS